jgi:peptidoglycan/LPS O-acetylase OafA/YrhL
MGIDGVNSYLTFFPGLPHLYEPQNWLRLITGTLNGLALAGLIYPILNQTLWRDWKDQPVLRGFRELGLLLALAAVMIVLVLSDNPIALLPLALLSVVGVLALIVALNTTVLLLVSKRENRVVSWTGAIVPLMAGFTLAIIEIGMVDLVRYSIFHTWSGFGIAG